MNNRTLIDAECLRAREALHRLIREVVYLLNNGGLSANARDSVRVIEMVSLHKIFTF